MLCKISHAFYKLVYFRLILGLLVGYTYRSSNASFIGIEGETCKLLDGKSIFTNYSLHFLKNTKARKGCKNKNNKKTTTGQDFLVKGWSIEDCITKVV